MGPGIPPQERELVFERVLPLDGGPGDARFGSGPGDRRSRSVLKHGGTLEVEDTVPGGDPAGTSVRIVLPGRRVLPESATATAPFAGASGAFADTRGQIDGRHVVGRRQ